MLGYASLSVSNTKSMAETHLAFKNAFVQELIKTTKCYNKSVITIGKVFKKNLCMQMNGNDSGGEMTFIDV